MSDFVLPFPVIVVDVGGTNARFALQPAPDAPLGAAIHLKTHDYPGLVEAAEAAIASLGVRPRSLLVCGAGPVLGRKLKLTNAPWTMDGPEAARRLGLAQGLLFNDFEAQALSLPAIPQGWARPIGPVGFGARGPAGDSRPRHRLGDRRAGRGGRPPHAARFRGLPYRLRPGRRRGERAVAAPRARLRPGDDRERAGRSRPGAGPCGAGRRARAAEADARRAGGRRRGARRSRRARRRRASGFTGASSPASPATWASPSSPPAA